MPSLFVIGNGFDLSHGLKTSYEDFHRFLLECVNDLSQLYRRLRDPSVEFSSDDIDFLISILSKVQGDEWWNVEEALESIDITGYLRKHDPKSWMDASNDIVLQKENDSRATRCLEKVIRISTYLMAWIYSIDISSAVPKQAFIKLIKQGDSFLSFNYTETLEQVYGINNVCHIHGTLPDQLVFGHRGSYEGRFIYSLCYPGSEVLVDLMHEALTKKSKSIIKNHESFFENLVNIDKVYSYGFSFSDVDMDYVSAICARLNEKTTWFLNDFNPSEHYKNTILTCGFRGNFGLYHID